MPSSTKTRKREGRLQEADRTAAMARKSPTPTDYFRWKPWLERPIALLLIVPAALVIAVLVAVVRLTSPGPAIFRQQRVGKSGRIFTMYKIRTMRQDAEAATGAVWAQQGDPRVTPVGCVLRKLHLDEFPQLLNVIKGEMSLIGPRPERPEFTQRLAVEIPGYLDRLQILPGVTGLAQINLPPDTDVDSVRRKLALDLLYVSQAGLFLDLRMLLCTATRVIGVPGDLAMRAFGLRRSVPEFLAAVVELPCVHDNAAVTPHLSGNRSVAHAVNGKDHRKNGNGHAIVPVKDFALPAVSDATNS